MTRPENFEFQEWWNQQRDKNNNTTAHDLLLHTSSPSNNDILTVHVTTPTSDPTVEKGRSRSARQLYWLCRLRFQQLFSFFASLANGVVYLLRISHRRISSSPSSSSSSSSRLYRLIKAFLVLVLILLCLELAAYFKGLHFRPPVGSDEVLGMLGFVYSSWISVRANYLAPPLQALTNVCIVLFLIQSVDRVVLMFGCFWIKFRKLKPVATVRYAAADEEKGNVGAVEEYYPMVLVQIPMCNEREVRTCRFHIPLFFFFFIF